jgi:prolyl-tRNA editing enzyme YbaK/EbsC (Cys-tRNA(Pro) deacylase)
LEAWPEPVERVAAVLRKSTVDARVEEFPAGTKTAAAAAEAVGCELAQIVKTLVFVCDGEPVLALLPGDRRADPAKVAAAVAARDARIATSEEVLAATGVEPGGVAPVPVPAGARVLVDRELFLHEIVWIGAGSPRHVAGLAPRDLARVAGAAPSDLAV